MLDDSPVRLTHYDPLWRQEFEQTRSSLLQACSGWVTCVEHIGSTAIPGLIARPTIDILAGVDDADCLAQAALLIEGLNFREVDSPEWAADSITLEKPRHQRPNGPDPTHRVFLMPNPTASFSRAVSIRNYLRSRMDEAIRFEETKVARWRNGSGNRAQYRSDKSIFFAHLIDQLEVDPDGA